MNWSLARWLVCLGALVIAAATQAFPVHGLVLDRFSKLPLSGAKVELWTEGARVESVITPFDGFFSLELSRGRKYVVQFSREGAVSRKVILDTHGIPRDRFDSIRMEINMPLFPPVDGMDSALVNPAIGEARWDSISSSMAWDMHISDPLTARWNTLLEAHLEQHPELRPTSTQRVKAWLFEQGTYWAGFLGRFPLFALYGILAWLLRRRKQSTRSWVVAFALICSVGLAVFWDAGGELRAVRINAFFLSIILAAWLIWEFFYPVLDPDMVPPTLEGDEEFDDLGPMDEDLSMDEEDEDLTDTPETVSSKWRERIYMFLFFGGILAFMLELDDLYNTLDVGKGLLILAIGSLASASIYLYWTTPSIMRRYFGLRFLKSISWAFIVFTFGTALASGINRSFSHGDERCETWPVVDVLQDGAIVRIGEDTKRLDLPVKVSSSLTSLDSLRCCRRTGVLGYEHIFSIEPMLTTDDPY